MKRLFVFASVKLVGYLQENEQYEQVSSYAPHWLATAEPDTIHFSQICHSLNKCLLAMA
jgi:hypothetical protein